VEIMALGQRYRRRGIPTIEEAQRVRDEIGKDLHGEFFRAG
jgi:hypothetical protein